MNWDQVEGNWKQLTGKAREKWGKLTDSDFETAAGKKDQLVGRIQERYGVAKDEADRQCRPGVLFDEAHEGKEERKQDIKLK